MNSFDAAVYLVLIVAVFAGYRSGLLRSLATIAGYLAAMAVAVAVTPRASSMLADHLRAPRIDAWLLFCGIFLATGIALSALLRYTISEIVGPEVSLPDRVAGMALGAVRVGLLAVLIVLIFDRIIPPDREPAFLQGSRLRPILSAAGQSGLRSLPPDVTELIDRMKTLRGL
jgi:membrane protein required for colicin V production